MANKMTASRHAKVKFPDTKMVQREEIPLPTYANALVALDALGVECTYDVFHDRRYVAGHVLENHVGQVTDDACLFIRALCRERFGFDPGKEHTWDAVQMKCRLHSFHPVRDYLGSLTENDFGEPVWDGVKRIDSWMTDYLGAPATDLIRTISRLVLVASVRRIMQPGCKWDYMPVLVGPENKAKSLALVTLYGQENFTDQKIFGVTDKELAEALRGRWCAESAELAGRNKADMDKVKAQISRQTDRVRPPYGRAVVDVPRECVLWGTTNDSIFMRFAYGNRRFIAVKVPGMVKIADLARDRDQLWAEAVLAEREHGPSLALPEAVWQEAHDLQEAHTEADPWDEKLYDVSERAAYDAASTRKRNEKRDVRSPPEPVCYQRILPHERERRHQDPKAPHGVERIASGWLLETVLSIPTDRQTPAIWHRLSQRMQLLGWSDPRQMKIGGRNQRGYERPLPAGAADVPDPEPMVTADNEADFV